MTANRERKARLKNGRTIWDEAFRQAHDGHTGDILVGIPCPAPTWKKALASSA